MNILGIDLGKFKSVCCMLNTETNETEFWTAPTERGYFQSMISGRSLQLNLTADLVVIEACATSGWVNDLCLELGVPCVVANPNEEAWRWKNVKRKTDRDDALKLAKLAMLDQLTPVHVPDREGRQLRSLIKFRKAVVGRQNRIQNNIRSLFLAQGIAIPKGSATWSKEGRERLTEHRKLLDECGPH